MWCEMGPAEPHPPTAFMLEISRKDQPSLDMCKDGTEGVPLQQAKFQIQGSPQSSSLSLTLPTRANRMDRLKRGSPKSKALENLKAKIQRQRLEMMTSCPLVGMKCQDHITRKVCRVSRKGKPVSQWKAHINPASGRDHHINPALQGTISTKKQEHYMYISAWRDAQKLVKEVLDSQCIMSTDSQENNMKRNKGKLIYKDHQKTAALSMPGGSKQRSNQPNVVEKSCHHLPSNIPHEHNQATSSAWPMCLKGKENEGPAKQSAAQTQKTQEVREYMHHKVLERRRKERQMRRKVILEQERKIRSVQDIVKKQKEALYRTKKQQAHESEKTKNADKEIFADSSKTLALQLNVQYAVLDTSRTLQMEPFSDALSKTNYPVHPGDVNSSSNIQAEAQSSRVEALKKTISSLNARVKIESVRLGITNHKEALTHTRPTGDKQEAADRKTQTKKIKNKKESVSINGNVPLKKEIKICVDEQAHPVMRTLQNEQGTSDQGDASESTDATCKWCDLSGNYSQGQFQCHLSLAQSQQFIWEEELRARQFSALFRLRQKALWERTQAELAWLEHCKNNALSKDDFVTEIKKEQEEVIRRLRHEEAEIHHWRNVYKFGRQQRHLLLYHHRDILDIKKTTNNFRQVLENQTMTETDSKPRDTASAPEGKSLITKPGIIPAARGEDKLPSKQGRLLTKAGLRRLLTAEEVWSLGRKRSLGEHLIPTEQEILQTKGSKDASDLKCFSAYSHRSKPCHNTSTERKVKREDGKPPHKQESVKANSKAHGYEPKTMKKVKSPLHKIDAHSKVSPTQSTEIHSGEKVHWTPLQDVHHFTSEHKQPSCGTAGNPSIVSCLSSDIDEDLPYDYEDIYPKPQEQTEPRFQESLKPHSFEMTVDCCAVITDNLTLNVQNSHESQNMVFNNNHEICDVSRKSNIAYTHTYETDLVSHISESLKWQNIKDSLIDKPLVTNSVHVISSDVKRTDSLSCDDSLSEAEDKSEPFSLQSEGLVCSEEEKDVHSEDKSEAGTFSLVYAEKFTVIPESPTYYNDCNTNHYELDPYDLFPNEKLLTAESNLSEILSPVDEVLSYGSAELPPSLKSGPGPGLDINILPPPLPAFEIITWTSEEDLPAAPDFLEDTSINSENIPPLPVDLSCRRDVERPDETNVNNDDNTAGLYQMFSTAEQDHEDEGSEYTTSFRGDDSNEDQDLLSSFNIGDRVLVYNSRQGVLKYKGYTAFANGFWAGIALDTPNGNHNGTFRGVKYFTCDKSCGVLVRAEDISHLHIEHCNNANTGIDKDKFSDEDPPSNNQDGENGNKPFKKRQRRQSGRHCSPGHDSSAPEQTLQQEACEKCEGTHNKLTTFSTSSEKKSIGQQIDCTSHLDPESEALIERLTEEIFADALKNIQGTGPKSDGKPKAINFKKKEVGDVINKPRLMDKWQQVYPASPPQIRVKPHEHSIVYRLVDCTVETLCGQENESALNACETPNYLVDDESRKTYRQVLFQLVSDILHKICGDVLEMSGSFQRMEDKSKISLLQTRQISVKLLKNAVKRETQKILHLEQTDQEMTEMLQTLCKYWYAKRDRVDYILIQELHNEEKEWVDYTNDQITVKMRLADEIFGLLVDDTISVLNHIYTADNPDTTEK